MKSKDIKKLEKALALIRQAQQLVNEVAESDKSFYYSGNAPMRDSRIEAAASIIKTEINNFRP